MTNETVTLIFSGIVTFSTVAYVILTWKLAKETRLSREFFLEANIVAYLENSETTPHLVSLIVKNIGKGVAKNVQFKITKDINYDNGQSLKEIGIFKEGINFFPPDNKFKFFLLSLLNDHDRANDSVTFKVEYSDGLKNKKSQWFTLNFKDNFGVGSHTPPDTYIGMISYKLEQIRKILEEKKK